jgi:hypothetical protein
MLLSARTRQKRSAAQSATAPIPPHARTRLPPRGARNHGGNPSASLWAFSRLAIIVPPPKLLSSWRNDATCATVDADQFLLSKDYKEEPAWRSVGK